MLKGGILNPQIARVYAEMGHMYTIVISDAGLGKKGLETALAHLNGETVEKSIILDSTLVTKDNVDTIKTKD